MPRVSEIYGREASANISLADQWAEAAHAHVEAEAAAQLLEETKSAVLAQMMSRLGDLPVSKAEMKVKASDEWRDHIEKMGKAREHANRLKVKREWLRMRFSEWLAHDANNRTQARL
jgi:hypothetical protein